MSEVQKICVGCSIDVSKSKRVKDTKGRYYCPECAAVLQKRAADRAASRAAPEPAPEPPARLPDPHADIISLDESDASVDLRAKHHAPRHTAPREEPQTGGGELELGEVRQPHHMKNAHETRTPAARKPRPADEGELDLGEVRQPQRIADEPKSACAACKKIIPESQIKNDDGVFLCSPCFEKRHAPKSAKPHNQRQAHSAPAPSKPPAKRLWPFK